jgi:hypothetical protein
VHVYYGLRTVETLDINETAWIGGEHYNIGCENETEDHLNSKL